MFLFFSQLFDSLILIAISTFIWASQLVLKVKVSSIVKEQLFLSDVDNLLSLNFLQCRMIHSKNMYTHSQKCQYGVLNRFIKHRVQ